MQNFFFLSRIFHLNFQTSALFLNQFTIEELMGLLHGTGLDWTVDPETTTTPGVTGTSTSPTVPPTGTSPAPPTSLFLED